MGSYFCFDFTSTYVKTLFCSNRAEEMNNSHLAEIEDDLQQQLARKEERVRDEVRMHAGFIAAL